MYDNITDYALEELELSSTPFDFGKYLRSIRQAKKMSIRELSKKVNKTATYLSDIENGNNKPPDKELLEKIIAELNLDAHPKLKNKLFDLAAIERNDIPADIKEHILNNKPLLDLIRKIKDSSNESDILFRVQNILNEWGDV